MYPHGLIGNCQISALINQSGSVDWLCLPRPDSAPIFGRILDPDGGHFSVKATGNAVGEQHYLPNSNILTTLITNEDGSVFKITDFCPRFYHLGRMHRPMALFRIVEPVVGSPSICVACKPVDGWSKNAIKPIRGNSHLKFEIQNEVLRLSTNMPLTYLCEETPFILKETLYFGLTWSYAIEEELPQLVNRFLELTLDYWKTWVKHCTIPSLYQKETIRSALTLKLHCYEDTGAILAALTTSLPEENGKGRNWDYRFCWLRDAYFVLSAFHNLGHFEEMEGFLKFLINIAEQHDHSRENLRPVYRLDQSLPLPETEHPNWQGYQNSIPVRSNNQAAEHIQNDVYGEMILTLSPIFFDERFHHLRSKEHERLLEHLAKLCYRNIGKADAGLWELRNGWQEHTFSNLMCWAGLDRIHKIQQNGFLKGIDFNLSEALLVAESSVRSAIKEGSLRNSRIDDSYDAALLQVATLRFPDNELAKKTIDRIYSTLKLSGKLTEKLSGHFTGKGQEDAKLESFLYRYCRGDDFGQPQSAFLICSFWLVQAFAKIGEYEKARTIMAGAVTAANPLGLFSEHYIPGDKIQCGNFPQAYSHVGQINAAFAISPPWGEVL